MGRVTQEALDALREAAEMADRDQFANALQLTRVQDALALLRSLRQQEAEHQQEQEPVR